jgi:hypothetical protein
LAVADAVAAQAHLLVTDGEVTARPTTAVLAAAASAAVVAGLDGRLGTVLDLAASLMVLTPARWDGAGEAELWAGHAALAGWMASILPEAGLTELPGGLAHTLSAATGTTLPAGTR